MAEDAVSRELHDDGVAEKKSRDKAGPGLVERVVEGSRDERHAERDTPRFFF